MYDATFGLEKADSFTLHVNGQASYIRGQNAVPMFDDTKSYQDAEDADVQRQGRERRCHHPGAGAAGHHGEGAAGHQRGRAAEHRHHAVTR